MRGNFEINIGTADQDEPGIPSYNGIIKEDDTPQNQNVNNYEIIGQSVSGPTLESTVKALERNGWELVKELRSKEEAAESENAKINQIYEYNVEGCENPELQLISSESVQVAGTAPTRASVKLNDSYPSEVRRDIAHTIHRLGEVTNYPLLDSKGLYEDGQPSTEEVLSEFEDQGTVMDKLLADQ